MYKRASDYIGNTPLIHLKNISNDTFSNIYLKLEYMNPWFSLKDRIAKNIILKAEESGELKPGGHIIEATSGNTGISLAGICSEKGYKLTIVMPEFVSEERKLILTMMGVDLVLTPTSQGLLGPVAKSFELAEMDENAFIVDQTRNPNNPSSHEETGVEIWDQLSGKVDCFISASGTGGHITGIGSYLKSQNNDLRVIAVEPTQAAVLSNKVSIENADGNHGIIGIGPGFIPKTLNRDIIDDVVVVDVEDCYKTTENVIKNEGLLIGVSTGAVINAAINIAKKESCTFENIVVVASSTTERYLSTKLADNARKTVSNIKTSPAKEKYIDMLVD